MEIGSEIIGTPLEAVIRSEWGGKSVNADLWEDGLREIGRLLVNAWSPEIDGLFLGWLNDKKCDCEACDELRKLVEIITDIDPIKRLDSAAGAVAGPPKETCAEQQKRAQRSGN